MEIMINDPRAADVFHLNMRRVNLFLLLLIVC